MRLSTKFGKIKLMRHTIYANSDNILFTINLSTSSIQEGSTKNNGTKIILWGTKNKKISRVFNLPTQDFNISNNPNRFNGVPIGKLNSNINVF